MTTAHFTARLIDRQYDPTPNVFDSLYRFYAAYLLDDEKNMRESVSHLSMISYLHTLADSDAGRFGNGSAQ
jgi:hypothetical protein